MSGQYFPVTCLLTLSQYLVVSSVDIKNLKILITFFLFEPLGCALVDPNVAGTGGRIAWECALIRTFYPKIVRYNDPRFPSGEWLKITGNARSQSLTSYGAQTVGSPSRGASAIQPDAPLSKADVRLCGAPDRSRPGAVLT